MVVMLIALLFVGLLIGAGILHLAFLAYFRFVAPPEESKRTVSQPIMPQSDLSGPLIRVTPRRVKVRRVPNLMEKMFIIFVAMMAQMATAFGAAYLGVAEYSILPGLLTHIVFLLVLTGLIAKTSRMDLTQSCVVTAFYLTMEISAGLVTGTIIAGAAIALDRETPNRPQDSADHAKVDQSSPSASSTPQAGQDINILVEGAGTDYSAHAELIISEAFPDHRRTTTRDGKSLRVTISAVKDLEALKKRIKIGAMQKYDPQTRSVRLIVNPQKDQLLKAIRETELGEEMPHSFPLRKGMRVFVRCGFDYLPATIDSSERGYLYARIEGVPSENAMPVRQYDLRLPAEAPPTP